MLNEWWIIANMRDKPSPVALGDAGAESLHTVVGAVCDAGQARFRESSGSFGQREISLRTVTQVQKDSAVTLSVTQKSDSKERCGTNS